MPAWPNEDDLISNEIVDTSCTSIVSAQRHKNRQTTKNVKMTDAESIVYRKARRAADESVNNQPVRDSTTSLRQQPACS